MTDTNFVLVYDILNEGLGWPPFLVAAGFLLGAAFGIFSFRRVANEGGGGKPFFVLFWLVIWIPMGIYLSSNMFYKRWTCLSQAKRGDVRIVEGEVQNFRRDSPTHAPREYFTVAGEGFVCSDSDWSGCGFNKTGVIRGGMYLRIAMRDGQILKLEIRQ